jgi:hypothetical protein
MPYFERNGLPMPRILTDRGTECCGRLEQYNYQLYLAINDIDHTKIDFPPIFLSLSQKKALTALAIRALLI